MLEQFLKYPGYIYQINGQYYYLGKWICKECTDTDATDCVYMYEMCRQANETEETAVYFHKIRAHSDFALEIPYDSVRIRDDLSALLAKMSEDEKESLQKQLLHFVEDYPKYCGELPA